MSHSCRKSLTLTVRTMSENVSGLELDPDAERRDKSLLTRDMPHAQYEQGWLVAHKLGVGEGWAVRKCCTGRGFAPYLGRMRSDKGIPGSGERLSKEGENQAAVFSLLPVKPAQEPAGTSAARD